MTTASAFWDKIAPKYAKDPIADVDAYEYTLGRTRSYLAHDDRVLELGCGTGSTALRLADAVEHIHATDFSPAMIDIAEQKARAEGITNINFEATDAKTPLQTQYDAVLAFNLLHLIEDVETTLERIAEQTKQGGYFISKTVCKPGRGVPLKLRLMLLALPIAQFFGKAPFVRFSEIAEHEAMITRAGFQIIETGNHPVAPPNRYVVARKL